VIATLSPLVIATLAKSGRSNPQRVAPASLGIALSLSLAVLPQRHAARDRTEAQHLEPGMADHHQPGDPELPPDAHPRQPADIDLLRQYATQLDADVIAVQEVDGPIVAARVFLHDKYSVHMSRDPTGVDITLTLQPAPLRILASVTPSPARKQRKDSRRCHLETGCFDRPLNKQPHGSCEDLVEQRSALIDWIMARRNDGIAFAIMGDFNRDMDGKDRFRSALQRAAH